MTHDPHDPLCWLHPDTIPVVCPCDCCLIGRVRAVMQEQIDSAYAMGELAVRQARRDERRRILSDGPYFTSVVHECCERVHTERVAALRDAVEVVRLSPSADIELVERSQVITEIEALDKGGK